MRSQTDGTHEHGDDTMPSRRRQVAIHRSEQPDPMPDTINIYRDGPRVRQTTIDRLGTTIAGLPPDRYDIGWSLNAVHIPNTHRCERTAHAELRIGGTTLPLHVGVERLREMLERERDRELERERAAKAKPKPKQ